MFFGPHPEDNRAAALKSLKEAETEFQSSWGGALRAGLQRVYICIYLILWGALYNFSTKHYTDL